MKYGTGYDGLMGFCCGWKVKILFMLLLAALFCTVDAQVKATRQTALDAFNKGNFELAYSRFSDLLAVYPRDPLYKYYSGVCLVKLEADPERAIELLSDARRDDAVVRTVPPDVLFWLGRAQQMAGRFDEAIDSFNGYTEQVGKKTARESGTQDYIQQCMDKRGKTTGSFIPDPEPETLTEPVVEHLNDTILQEVTEKKEIPLYRPPASEELLPPVDSLEILSGVSYDTVKKKKATVREPETTYADTTFEAVFDEHVAEAVKQPSAQGVLELFMIREGSDYDPGERIEINPEHPAGLIYRIQVAVLRNPVTISHFKGIVPVYGIRNSKSDLTTYYAGMFRKNDDARKALPLVRGKGFRDAFIVAFSGGKPVSLQRAAIMEKEWGVIPFISVEQLIPETETDTIPPTLSFRVEVIRTPKPVSEESYDEMKTLSGTRGLDIETLPDGNIVYLIGQFITFESAERYADLLVRNGYRDAKVVAWLGKKEIPVETAIQLFNSLK